MLSENLPENIRNLEVEWNVGDFYGLADWATFEAGINKGLEAAAQYVEASAAAEQAEPALAARSGAVKVEWQQIAKVIAENLPSPYALDDVWRQTSDGACFDLSQAREETKSEWKALAIALAALEPAEPATDAEPVILSEKSFTEIMGWVDNPPKPTEKLKEIYQAYIDNKSKSKSENTHPPESRLREAALGVKRIVEEIDGAMKHGTWRDEKGIRLKDTPEWLELYNAITALAQEDGR